MARRNETVSKVHFKGKDEDFIMFVEDEESVNKWKKDRSVPLAQVVSGFKVFVTNKHGAQGLMNEASKAQLESEFGTTNEAIIKILEGGTVQTVESPERNGPRNVADGTANAH